LPRIKETTYLNAIERKIAMALCHAVTAMQQTLGKAIFALVFADSTPAGDTEVIVQEVTMAIMTK
jgi:hypothetical protein